MAHQVKEPERRGFELIAVLDDRFSLERGLSTLSEPDAQALLNMDRGFARLIARASWGVANHVLSPLSRFGSTIENRYLSADSKYSLDARLATAQLDQLVRESSTVLGYSTTSYDGMNVLLLQETARAVSEVLERQLHGTRRGLSWRRSKLGNTPTSSQSGLNRQSLTNTAARPSGRIGATGQLPASSRAVDQSTRQTFNEPKLSDAAPSRRAGERTAISGDTLAKLRSFAQKHADRYNEAGGPHLGYLPYPESLGSAGRDLKSRLRDNALVLGAFTGLSRTPLKQLLSAQAPGLYELLRQRTSPAGGANATTKFDNASDGVSSNRLGNEARFSASGRGGKHAFKTPETVAIDGVLVPKAMTGLTMALQVADAAFVSGNRTHGRWLGPQSVDPMLSIVRTGTRDAKYSSVGFDSFSGRFVNLTGAAPPYSVGTNSRISAAFGNKVADPTNYAQSGVGVRKGKTNAGNSRPSPTTVPPIQKPTSLREKISHSGVGNVSEHSNVQLSRFTDRRSIDSVTSHDVVGVSHFRGGGRNNENRPIHVQLAEITPLIRAAEILRNRQQLANSSATGLMRTVIAERFSETHKPEQAETITRSLHPSRLFNPHWVISSESSDAAMNLPSPIAAQLAGYMSSVSGVSDEPALVKFDLIRKLEFAPALLKQALFSSESARHHSVFQSFNSYQNRLSHAVSVLSRQDSSLGEWPTEYALVSQGASSTSIQSSVLPTDVALAKAVDALRAEAALASKLLVRGLTASVDRGTPQSWNRGVSSNGGQTVGDAQYNVSSRYGGSSKGRYQSSGPDTYARSGLRVSVRMPDNSVVALPPLVRQSSVNRTDGAGQQSSVNRTPVHIILPSGGMTQANPIAAMPGLVYAIQKRLTAAAVSLLGTDLGRAAALGVGETVITAVRPFLDGKGANSQLASEWLRNLNAKADTGFGGPAEGVGQAVSSWRAKPQGNGGIELELVRPFSEAGEREGLFGHTSGTARQAAKDSNFAKKSRSNAIAQTSAHLERNTSAAVLSGDVVGEKQQSRLRNLRSAVAGTAAQLNAASSTEDAFGVRPNVLDRTTLSAIEKLTSAGFAATPSAAALVGSVWMTGSGSQLGLFREELPQTTLISRTALRFADKMFSSLGFGTGNAATGIVGGPAENNRLKSFVMDLLVTANRDDGSSGFDPERTTTQTSAPSPGSRLHSTPRFHLPNELVSSGQGLSPEKFQNQGNSGFSGLDRAVTPAKNGSGLIMAGAASLVAAPSKEGSSWADSFKLINPAIRDNGDTLLPRWVSAGSQSLIFGLHHSGENGVTDNVNRRLGWSSSLFELVRGENGSNKTMDHHGGTVSTLDDSNEFSGGAVRRMNPSVVPAVPRKPSGPFRLQSMRAWHHANRELVGADSSQVGTATKLFRRAVGTDALVNPSVPRNNGDIQRTMGTMKNAFLRSAWSSPSLQFVDLTAMRHLESGVAVDSTQSTTLENRRNIHALTTRRQHSEFGQRDQLHNVAASVENARLSAWEVDVLIRTAPTPKNPFGIQSNLDPNWVQLSGNVERGVFSSHEFSGMDRISHSNRSTRTATLALSKLLNLGRRLPSQASIRNLGLANKTELSHDVLVRLERALDTVTNASDAKGGGVGRPYQRAAAAKPVDGKPKSLGSETLADLALLSTIDSSKYRHTDDSAPRILRPTANERRTVATSRPSANTSTLQVPNSAGRDVLSFVAPQNSQFTQSQSGMDAGRIAKAAASSGRLSIAELPLIAPMAATVTQQALLNSEQDAKPTNPSPTVTSNGEKSEQQSREPKVNLDKLAIELANTFVSMSQRELERRGIWGSR
ncbi:MAG: hypothetical protein HUU55_09940 [Myxococcales bacterium]|nr:hypothetical protein [Myxococcales bacterium]